MKTQIIHIESHDDYISVRDKMTWGQTARILLVWPPDGQALTRRFDLVMLKRYSQELGAQLALVTKNRQVRAHARKLELIVYPNIRKAQQSYWRKPRRRGLFKRQTRKKRSGIKKEQPKRAIPDFEALRLAAHPAPARWLNHLVTRLIIFTLGVLAVLAIAAIFIPSAQIQLQPNTRQDTLQVPIQASPDYTQVNVSGLVPATWASVIVEGRDQIAVTGSTSLPNKSASGEVIFTNLTDQPIVVPAGTVVTTIGTQPVRFATTRAATIPTGEQGAFVPIEAILPGRQGNLESGAITAIEGPLGLDLTVTNRAITRGGSIFNVPAPSSTDYQELYALLYTSLQQTAWVELQAGLENGDLLLGIEPEYVQTLEETYFPQDSTPSDELQLTLRLEFRAPVVRSADINAVAQAALRANLPAGYSPIEDTLEVYNLGAPRLEEPNTGAWEILAQWQVLAQLDRDRATRLVLGQTPALASQELQAHLPLDGSPNIELTPGWWPRLPILPFRVQIMINEPSLTDLGDY